MEMLQKFKESTNIFKIDKFAQAKQKKTEKNVNTWNHQNGIINNMILVRLCSSVAQ